MISSRRSGPVNQFNNEWKEEAFVDSKLSAKRKSRKRKSPPDGDGTDGTRRRQKVCCELCSGSDHLSIYYKICPDFVPVDSRPTKTVVTYSLGSRVKHDMVLEVLKEACDRVSTMFLRITPHPWLCHEDYGHKYGTTRDRQALHSNSDQRFKDEDKPRVSKTGTKSCLPDALLAETKQRLFGDMSIDTTGLTDTFEMSVESFPAQYKTLTSFRLSRTLQNTYVPITTSAKKSPDKSLIKSAARIMAS